jgi:hypothetical protein
MKAKLWAGRIITGLTVLFLIFDGVTKLMQVSQVKEGMATLGYPARRVRGGNGNQAAPNSQAWMPMPLPNKPFLPRRWHSPVRLHGYTSTRLSRA